MKINILQGDLTDISAKKEPLLGKHHRLGWCWCASASIVVGRRVFYIAGGPQNMCEGVCIRRVYK